MKEFAWPNEFQPLFEDGGTYREFAHFGWGDLQTQIAGYSMGYKKAADLLVDDAISTGDTLKLDTFIFPALFLYRQYIELTLKKLIIQLNDWKESEILEKFDRYNHNLSKLWDDFSKISREISGEGSDAAMNIVGKYINEFHIIDERSFSFRYPFTKKLEKIFGNDKRIDLKNIKDRMAEIENFFNGAGDFLYTLKHGEKL